PLKVVVVQADQDLVAVVLPVAALAHLALPGLLAAAGVAARHYAPSLSSGSTATTSAGPYSPPWAMCQWGRRVVASASAASAAASALAASTSIRYSKVSVTSVVRRTY